jgi:hypothetical protein
LQVRKAIGNSELSHEGDYRPIDALGKKLLVEKQKNQGPKKKQE